MSWHYDLDLLRYLQVLLEEQSVSAAARRMKVSEPTMSRQLGKLRETFKDQILVQSGRRMIATSYAMRIRDRVQDLVRNADSLMHDRDEIDFSHLSPNFVIRANDLMIGAFGSALLLALRKDCPQCNVYFAPETDGHQGNMLREERTDLYIGATNDLRPEIRQQTLFSTSFRGLVRENHPILLEGITPENLIKYDYISISRKGHGRGPIDSILEENYGLKRRIALIVPSYYAMVESLHDTDMILPLPSIVIDNLPISLIHLETFDFPFELPCVSAFQAWHPRWDTDPVHRWLRDTMFRVARSRTK
ncbi:MAG: LysR family transcriptional regulator [Zymomonas mobilis subsp. pomaceae]|uniref:Transcriptional regulator, LysR family n=1 Tax=Zymomonas mobilis subsp. pomaceae (strain ATCC 29192 / DSM 22645 / JCM 10191 / CCUG 17912 / NBRC 13757 / NCIMB 11200 / NRRL B-4491 / Barker I) TaxID=579138 RepID=F8EUD5_ZYMMT|nr:LysR family transcriptional regulator [Zymomonas mobilis]AEI38156.1 transcriptional regulator, LysR family [Zymomonas mobilis subsp. pomaceae ATCC 29192]MDX5947845.1 LysR family transcriptional regulator [Zymomonas mobilis subsp. pomaceae]GEB90047.1 transcriptional regulator [Zymomonas mobilis subsp. pomaceae]